MKVYFSSFTTGKLGTDQCLEHLSCRLLILQTYMFIWKRSLPKCNLRMAQGTKCLHAICNYMRKVKLKYQHVRPAPALHINTVYLVYLHFLTGLLGPMIHNSTTLWGHTYTAFICCCIYRTYTYFYKFMEPEISTKSRSSGATWRLYTQLG